MNEDEYHGEERRMSNGRREEDETQSVQVDRLRNGALDLANRIEQRLEQAIELLIRFARWVAITASAVVVTIIGSAYATGQYVKGIETTIEAKIGQSTIDSIGVAHDDERSEIVDVLNEHSISLELLTDFSEQTRRRLERLEDR